MNIALLEGLLANLSEYLMTPVLICIVLLLIYAIYAIGLFAGMFYVRRKNAQQYRQTIQIKERKWYSGYPIHNYFVNNPKACEDELEIFALKKLENLRVVTRVAPMLGLIATMVPMGPALKALADGNIQGISESLIIAFASVIWGLVIATLTFWPASVKKRWFASELINIRKLRGA
ncbi:MotA/TolQ/ExbB proton channel family protein [Shewanella sp.]|uniref:MotA/TolQ/ExbB proton channel family protein n=1 Tax=Shewanella sp. TaxID=50422 RepID=UPI00259067E6|nr:MotA/TolQ/ExbB proton channel family protein [Shewanella sp.]MCJ8302801.1 MotA/TolQ/ExbB proton channel family protein [Shewanella sp.]